MPVDDGVVLVLEGPEILEGERAQARGLVGRDEPVKGGIGEGGACGAPPALVNAVLDALKARGVTEIDMPLGSEKIWRLLNP